jgi:hypothetical protein
MGLFLRQEDNRSELQTRIAAELREKLAKKQGIEHKEPEPAFLDDQHQTRPAGMILIVLAVILVIAIVLFALHAGGIV